MTKRHLNTTTTAANIRRAVYYCGNQLNCAASDGSNWPYYVVLFMKANKIIEVKWTLQ